MSIFKKFLESIENKPEIKDILVKLPQNKLLKFAKYCVEDCFHLNESKYLTIAKKYLNKQFVKLPENANCALKAAFYYSKARKLSDVLQVVKFAINAFPESKKKMEEYIKYAKKL